MTTKPRPQTKAQAITKAKSQVKPTRTTTTRRPPRPVTDAERVRVRELQAEGRGRNEIGRMMGRSAGWVTARIKEAGADFDRSRSAEAVAARIADMKQRNVDIAELLQQDILALRDRAWSEHRWFERGDGVMVEMATPLPPIRDQRDAYSAITSAIKGYTDLQRSADGATSQTKRSVLENLFAGIQFAMENPESVEFTESAPEESNGESV